MYKQILLCSQQSVCPGPSHTTGFIIFGLYMYNKAKKATFSCFLLQQSVLHTILPFQELEADIVDFVKDELKRHKTFVTSGSQCLGGLGEDEQMVDDGPREAFLKILLHFLKIKNKEDLANYLQSSKDLMEWKWEMIFPNSSRDNKYCVLLI